MFSYMCTYIYIYVNICPVYLVYIQRERERERERKREIDREIEREIGNARGPYGTQSKLPRQGPLPRTLKVDPPILDPNTPIV